MIKKQKKMLVRILITAVMLIALKFIPITGIPQLLAYVAAYLVIGYDILRKAGKGILNGRAFDENFLMALATLGAFVLAVWTKSGDYVEGIAVMLFYQIGELFQSYAVGRSRKNISALMDIRPDYANIEQDGQLTQVDPDEVAVGSIIVVQPGEKVPLDGVIVEGAASLNTSALTGESLPRDVKAGDEIISGCIDLSGVLKIRTTKAFGESTVSKILDLVENASSRKSRSETFISRFAKVYTPAVCAAALALAILVPLGRMLAGLDANWTDWVYRALSFLVVSCPCALVISIPLSFFAGIGGASKEGVLIKGSNYLEALSAAKVVVFDKTGTLTRGVFEVTAVHHSPLAEKQLLEYRLQALDEAIGLLNMEPGSDFSVQDVPDKIYVYASNGRDFSVAGQAGETISRFVELLSISSYARVIETAQFSSEKPELDPSYVCAIPASEEWRLGTYDRTHVHWMNLGKCIVYHRSLTREESVRKETFALLLDWMTAHGYHMREKMMILPGFLNLDGCGKDMETVILPVI